MYRVLFVCTGNTCRSPMARAALLHLCAGDPRLAGRVEGQSAGLLAAPGAPMSRNAGLALAGAGIPVPEHAARGVDEGYAAQSDLILALTQGHARELVSRFPTARAKVFVLAPTDIPDPFGGNAEVYRECLARIMAALEDWRGKLYHLLDERGEQ